MAAQRDHQVITMCRWYVQFYLGQVLGYSSHLWIVTSTALSNNKNGRNSVESSGIKSRCTIQYMRLEDKADPGCVRPSNLAGLPVEMREQKFLGLYSPLG